MICPSSWWVSVITSYSIHYTKLYETTGALSAAEFPSLDNLWQQTQQVALHGPVILKLEDQATLRLPSGYEYIPQPEASRWLQAIGQQGDRRLLGLILSDKQEQDWMIRVRLYRDGFLVGDVV